jgi:hypothetical protein
VFPLPAPVTCSSHLQHTVGYPLVDNDAILDMVSGLPLQHLDINEIHMNIETTIPAILPKITPMTTMTAQKPTPK